MRILLTGGSGFIGRNIIENASESFSFLAPRHQELDLADEASVRSWFSHNPVDAVIHSATKPGHRNASDPTNIAITNLHMFSNLFEASQKANVSRLIFLGSGSEYDMQNYSPKMDETRLGEHIPADDTGFSKYICTRIMQGVPGYINVRFFGIFGKYEDYAIRFISNAICKALFDLPITLRQDKKFDYTSASDGVRAIERFLEVPVSRLTYTDYNVTPDESIGLLEIALLVKKVAGKPDLPVVIGKSGQGREYSGKNERFMQLFPDFSFTAMEESVQMLYDWYASRMDQLDREKLLVDK